MNYAYVREVLNSNGVPAFSFYEIFIMGCQVNRQIENKKV